MIKEIPITEARDEITSLPERLMKEAGAVPVTRRGKPVLAILSWEFYESLMETLEVMGDPEMTQALRQGIKEAAASKGIPWGKAKKSLRL